MSINRSVLKEVILDAKKDIGSYVINNREVCLDTFPLQVLVGVRRCGKSFVLYQQIFRMLDAGHSWDEITYIDFEDQRLSGFSAEDFNLILECHTELYGTRPILFLDEINCVSETLAPSMLQFLQYKTFGRHQVPDGWVIVTAGNPPEFNKSVREFDVVTMDRLKVLEGEADLDVWKQYALEKGIHPAVTNFLDLKKDCFYVMEMTAKGRSYATARGWEDLSQMLMLYEQPFCTVHKSYLFHFLFDGPRLLFEISQSFPCGCQERQAVGY